METSLHKSVVLGDAAKEENKGSESNGDKEGLGKEIVLQVGTGKIVKDDDGMKHASPDQKNFTSSKQLNERLESAKSEMGKVIEENQRLKMYLDQILKDYRTLQMQYQDHVAQQEAAKTCPNTAPTNRDQTEEPQLIALSLGRNSSGTMEVVERQKIPTNDKLDEGNERLKLQMDCKYQVPKMLSPAKHCLNPSPENSLKEVETMKNVRDCGEDEISLQNPGKRARVSVRVRCDTPTMNDGCQWRKYGQKIAKGNPCPRAYYRCTVGPSCPVRKQVQRYAKDMSILITTYEGKHNHPLSVSATALGSATSAAAAMLFTGSSTSDLGPSSSSATTTTANLNGLNFYLSDNTRSKPLYLQNSSISSSPSYPTITLDLTTTPSSSSLSHLSRLGHFPLSNPTPNPNFNPLESSALPSNISWHNGILSYGHQPCNKSQSTNSRSFGENPNETLFQSCEEKNTVNPSQQNLAPDTIAAATKAITSDPRFQSALVAALSSIIGSGGDNNGNLENRKIAENSTENIKSSEPFPIISSFTATPNAQKCSPSSINKSSSSTSSQWGGFTFNSPLFSLSNSRSKSNSSGDHNRDHII